jgi:hypothetical protein
VGGGDSPDGLANEALHWLVERAEGFGLEVDSEYLKHFRPCFNSTLTDSMTALYRLLGQYHRPVGEHRQHGEQIHQSVIDRLHLNGLNYAPGNLPQPLLSGANALPVVNTNRIARGTPCEAAQEHPSAPR